MHRRFRVCRLLPPRKALGARSRTITRAPRSAAVRAADSAALPPPRTATSYVPLTLNTKSVLDPNDARDMSDDVLSLPPLDFVVDDAGEQDAGVADDDVHRRDGLRGVIGKRWIAVQ